MKDADRKKDSSEGLRCNCTALRKATRRVSQLYDEALAPSGLKTTQRAILAEIRRSGPMTVRTLADKLVMDPGGLAHTLKPLIRDKLVANEVDPNDRRNRLISLTAAGKTRVKQSDRLWQEAQRSFEKSFGTEKSKALRDAVDLLISEQFTENFYAAMTAK
jgi:DNA-binding MarR family transcriptional regulator